MLNKKLMQIQMVNPSESLDENKPRYMQNTKSSHNLLNYLENTRSEHFATILKAYETNKMTAEEANDLLICRHKKITKHMLDQARDASEGRETVKIIQKIKTA